MTSGTPDNVKIEKRRSGLRFAGTDAILRWSGSSVAEQLFLDTFSCYLPLGERFFVDSVRHYENEITDAKLREEIRCFMYQEAQHSISHQNFNHALYSRNKLARLSEMYIGVMAKITRVIFSRRFQLSITVAAEHFTAIISNWLITSSEAFQKKNDPVVARLWVWHAIEEIEHKSVAFDVFTAVTPNIYHAYILRIIGMLAYSMTLIPALVLNMPLVYLGSRYHRNSGRRDPVVEAASGTVAENLVLPLPPAAVNLKAVDGPAGPRRNSSLKYIARFLSRLAGPYLDYYRFTFHPWQHDNSRLLNDLKSRFDFDAVIQRPE